jgi:PAS domain S-box-containing protein
MTSDADISAELAEARRRVAELQTAEAERRHSETVQSALYRIAELASAAQDMQEFYRAVHGVVGELMSANNFYIALYDDERQLINYPYWADEVDEDWPDANEWVEFSSRQARGLTGYVLRAGAPQLITYERLAELIEQSEIELVGVASEQSSWLGVPLKPEGRTVGVLAVQSYTGDVQYGEQDKELLAFVGQHVGAALSRARAIEETLQRNAELALINSVQEALAGELDMQAIYDLVGDKLQEIFDAQVVDIGIFDFDAGLVRFTYTVERGVRFPYEEVPLTTSPTTRQLLETKAAVLINNVPAWERERDEPLPVPSGEPALAVLVVPLTSGDELRGRISLQNLDRTNVFTESDVRLLTTLAGSLSVTLENARLVHETRQRNAELALINSVQEALAGELELQAIYGVVGDKIQEIFDAQVVDIAVHDEASGLLHFPYSIERGRHDPEDPIEMIGFRRRVIETGRPLLINQDVGSAAERFGNPLLSGEMPKSVLYVPLVAGGGARGVISLQNIDREHAFSASDQQLLETLARSLSVALENARLVHETRQRNAELALINSVQRAIAGELDPQAIYDLVGDKLQEVFDAQVVSVSTYDEATGLLSFPYVIERGDRLYEQPIELIGFRKHVIQTREPLIINEDMDAAVQRYGNPRVLSGEAIKSAIFVPLIAGGKASGVVSLQNVDREHAFTKSDLRLLLTLCGSLSVALENARLVHETRQRNAELALINSVQEAIAGELDPQAIYDLVGDRIREVFDAQAVNIAVYDEATGMLELPYAIERGVRLEIDAMPVMGFRKHVMETAEPLMINENMDEANERYGNPAVLAGQPSKSDLWVPLIAGGKPTGVISLQNVDREHAFTESDQRLLVTLAGSLSVALENARLVHETRQRVAELATVNSVGTALSAQLELDALIELVGERVRETFSADIAYVALHDEESQRIDFVYYYETGERRPEPALQYGEGLTSQILEAREPLLLNRQVEYEGRGAVGTPAKSYLGVPILAGDRAIGVISVQSVHEEGRFAEPDVRLLATIASNVGVAIQTARLFAEIERQREHFESLVEISPVAVVVMDADERVSAWNPAAAELFGHTAEEAVGRQIDDLVFGDDFRDEGREITREALTNGRAHRITRRRRKDGSAVDVELMLVPLTVEDERVGFLGVYHDITELQRAREEAEAATQAKSAFLATMSHEIRTPMNAVIGMTGLLLGTELTAEQRDFAEVVRSSGDALLHVIDDILDYSKIEAGKLELERNPFDLRECVESALDIVAPRASQKEIELGCLVDDGVPPGIVGDVARLRQVLLNLLSNAVKFTEEGEVVVHVGTEPSGAGSHRLRLAVRDTGIGIPQDRMERLFGSFSQVDASTTRRYGGTGLGLAISKRLVELMGGTMSVESEEGEGSTFRIELPIQEAEVSAQIAVDDGLPQLVGRRLLLVDDNATNREIVMRQARSWGIEPVAVESPLEALSLIEAGEPFDVAVLDLVMAGMDGVALAREIRRHRDARELPLILLTSVGRLPHAHAAAEFSAQLSKPIKASQLYNALLGVLIEPVEKPRIAEPTVAGGDRAIASPLRILLAEDNAVNQKVALALLERLGYRADVAWNGVEALAALERRRYDVVLMDVQMPEVDGLDASRRICERWPREGRPRIIAMTANALLEDREACFAAGMDDYLAKPIRPKELAEALSRARPLGNNGRSTGEGAAQLEASALESLRELGGDDFIGEVVGTFLANAPSLMASLRGALQRGDAGELRRTAHTLKSNGQTFGASRFAELCHELEERARSGELDGAGELADRIDHEYAALAEALVPLQAGPSS